MATKLLKLNVLYLSYDGMTDPLGQSQVLPYLNGLAKKGYVITLISFEKQLNYSLHNAVITTICEQNNINWQPILYTKTPPVLSTLYDVYKLNKKVKKSISSNKIELIHCRSYITALIGLAFKQKYGIKMIFDMRGFWADERVDGSIWNLNNPIFGFIYNFFKRKEIDFLNLSDYTISLTQSGKQEIKSWKQINSEIKIEVIPCCTDETLFNKSNFTKSELLDLKSKLNITQSDYMVSYLGSIGTWYMLDEMLDFFSVLKKSKPNAKFLFITKDAPKLILDKVTAKSLSKKDIIITSAERQDVPKMILISNLSLFFIKPLFSKKASSATKMGEIMSLGVPIICNHIGDNTEILKNSCPKMIVNEFSKTEYQRVITDLETIDESSKDKLVEKAKDYFSLTKGIGKYAKVYHTVINESKN